MTVNRGSGRKLQFPQSQKVYRTLDGNAGYR